MSKLCEKCFFSDNFPAKKEQQIGNALISKTSIRRSTYRTYRSINVKCQQTESIKKPYRCGPKKNSKYMLSIMCPLCTAHVIKRPLHICQSYVEIWISWNDVCGLSIVDFYLLSSWFTFCWRPKSVRRKSQNRFLFVWFVVEWGASWTRSTDHLRAGNNCSFARTREKEKKQTWKDSTKKTNLNGLFTQRIIEFVSFLSNFAKRESYPFL